MSRRNKPPEADPGPETVRESSVRERLLQVAAEVFARKGYAAASVSEIVEAAGVTKPVLYYYFRSKEGIYQELMAESLQQYEAILQAARAESGSAIRRIFSLCDRTYALCEEYIPLLRLMYSLYYGPPQGAPFFDFDAIFHRPFQEILHRLVEEGISRGELRPEPPEDMVCALIGALNIAMELRLCHPDNFPGRAGLTRVLRLVFQGLAAEPRPLPTEAAEGFGPVHESRAQPEPSRGNPPEEAGE